MGLLKRNAADRFDFDIFFNHPFIRPVVEEPPTARVRTSPVKVPSADRGSRNTTPVATEAKSLANPTQSREPTQNKSDVPSSLGSNTNYKTRPGENIPTSPMKAGTSGRKTSPTSTKPISTTPRGQQPGVAQSPNPRQQYTSNADNKSKNPVPVQNRETMSNPKQPNDSKNGKPSQNTDTTKVGVKRHGSGGSGSSPDQDDFVMVPTDLTKDAAEVRKHKRDSFANNQVPTANRRHTVSGTSPLVTRPSHLPGVGINQNPQNEPIPVPTQKLAYQQIQESLIRSRTRSGESAMSGISSTGSEGASTLGPLPEEGTLRTLATASNRLPETGVLRKSPTSSPSHHLKSRRVSAPPQQIPDICQLSPPSIQFTLGNTPPTGLGVYQSAVGGRRRTSSSSSTQSCGTPPPPVQWQISPNSPIVGTGATGRITPTMTSPVRRHTVGNRTEPINSQAAGSTQIGFYNNPNGSTLSPILGSPNKTTTEGGTLEGVDNNAQKDIPDVPSTQSNVRPRSGSNTSCGTGRPRSNSNTSKAVMQWQGGSDAEINLSDAVSEAIEGGRLRHAGSDLQFPAGRNVVVNFGAQQPFSGLFDRSSKSKTLVEVITVY